ncbi:MAG: helix-turn-helix domain-containing protein [Pseudohongiellaceae bacterium]
MNQPEHEVSSGNIYADIGFVAPIEARAKAELAKEITGIIKHKHLSEAATAKLLGVNQATVSRLLRGPHKEFSMDILMTFILKLGQAIEIRIKQRQSDRMPPGIEVMTL